MPRMCGRFALKIRSADGFLDDAFLADGFLKDFERSMLLEIHGGLNLKPGDKILFVPLGSRSAALALWGFTSPYGSDLLINARAETIHEKPLFREAFRHRRCLVPADGWYEWSAKQPHYIHRTDNALMAFAGIWQPGPIPRMAIITQAAAPALAAIHHRMPAIIPPTQWDAWLDPSATTPALAAMLAPHDASDLEAYPVRAAGSLERFTPERSLFD